MLQVIVHQDDATSHGLARVGRYLIVGLTGKGTRSILQLLGGEIDIDFAVKNGITGRIDLIFDLSLLCLEKDLVDIAENRVLSNLPMSLCRDLHTAKSRIARFGDKGGERLCDLSERSIDLLELK